MHLVRTEENVDEIDELAERLGGRAGLPVLLEDLSRRARRTLAPGRAVHRALTWDAEDRRDQRWWPQGISTSADASDTEDVEGRRMLVVSWYAKDLPGEPGSRQGSRLTFLDLATRRYRHVLLVNPRGPRRRAGPGAAPRARRRGRVVRALPAHRGHRARRHHLPGRRPAPRPGRRRSAT